MFFEACKLFRFQIESTYKMMRIFSIHIRISLSIDIFIQIFQVKLHESYEVKKILLFPLKTWKIGLMLFFYLVAFIFVEETK